MASSSSDSTSATKFDVFLSFRGEDTRNTFTSHLHAALCKRKIETFIDNELRKGDEISAALSKTIEDSSLSIIILSKNYASSTWCLNELLKILDCKQTKGQIVLPVFYHVLPSDARKQSGSFKEAFAKHEKCFRKTKDKVSNWRAALTQVATLSGWDIKEHDGSESEFIEKIVKDILKKLKHMSSCDHLDDLVGILSRVEKAYSLLCFETVDFRIMGIWGMAGVGKTTIARAIFNQIANQFESCCFLVNISEESAKCGMNNLQEKLLSDILEDENLKIDAFALSRLRRKKVLIVLDDVNNAQHLKHLVGDRSWYGPKSRIIITSRDKQVLKNGAVDVLYELKELDYRDALQLFSLNAFNQRYPVEEYMELSNRVVYYAKGNPLALKVLGCFLQGRGKQEWKSSLNKLKKCLNLDIQNVLRISYDGLDDQEKDIFLNIACFFKGQQRDHVTAVLNGCGLSAEIGISVLVDKCLVTITEKKLLTMHDLVQEMGHSIVYQESTKEPGKRSRLWDSQDIYNLFKKNTGTNAVESISLDLSQINELHLNSDAFTRMQRLRYLKFYSSQNSKGDKEDDKVHLCQGLEELPDELRYLHWHRYPLRSLPSKFNSENLVDLQLPYSNVQHFWKENLHLENLRRIDLSYSQYLTEGPNLSRASNLQTMVLNGCSRLTKFPEISWNIKELHLGWTAIEEVPSAIGCLSQLVSLNLYFCRRLKNLPCNIRNLTSLMELNLGGCVSITEFPEISGDVKYLFLDGTAVEEVPSSIERLTKLYHLSLQGCTSLIRVSSSIFKLESLASIDLLGCSKVEELPEVSETKGKLRSLYLGETAIKELPASLELLPVLSQLNVGHCKHIKSLPNSICNMKSLSMLGLSGFSGVDKMLEDLPLSTSSSLCALKNLNLSECNLLALPSALSCLSFLEHLNLSGNNFEILNLKPFSCLKSLDISHCKRLQSLQEFPLPSRLLDLQAHHCISLQTLPTSNVVFTGDWNSQQSFTYSNCLKLDANARVNIMTDAQLRIQVMAAKARGTASMEDYLKEYMLGASVSFCFPGNEIPEWFSHQNWGSSVIIDLPPHWCSTKFLGFALCIVVAFQDCKYFDFSFNCKCYFLTKDGELHEIVCDLKGMGIERRLGFLESNHMFLLYAHGLSSIFQRDDGEHNLSIYSYCHKALFEFTPVDMDLQPLPSCKIKGCGVHLLYLEDEDTQNRGDDTLNEEEPIESKGDGISDVRNQEDPNSETLEETEHSSSSEIDTLLLGKSKVKLMFKKVFLVGLALFLLWWCLLGNANVEMRSRWIKKIA